MRKYLEWEKSRTFVFQKINGIILPKMNIQKKIVPVLVYSIMQSAYVSIVCVLCENSLMTTL